MNQLTTTTSGLTLGQQAGADSFFAFLMSSAPTFVLSGGAGVGKTFLMSHICKRVMKDYQTACAVLGLDEEYDTLVFTATTNKAAEVLEQALGLPVVTIHSFLGLRVTEDFKTGKTNIQKTNRWKVRKRHIVFIDECSMVDQKLYQILLESFEDSKIIFVGDHAQMAPVSEENSLVFTEVDEDNFVFLSEPVRNAGSPALIALCAQLRETVETGVFHPIEEVPGHIDWLDDTTMPQQLHAHFKDLDPSARVLCYTNTRVEAFNEFIREEVRGMSPEFGVGDIVVVAQNHTAFSFGKEVTINVERELEIVSLGRPEEDHTFKDATNGRAIPYRDAVVRPVSGQVEYSVKLPLNKDMLTAAVKHYASKKDWTSYFELKGRFIDLRDKAACTVYKSQGSTYDTVFIDLGNIGTSYDAKQVARMLFVAASRATTRIFLYGRLPRNYIGKAPT